MKLGEVDSRERKTTTTHSSHLRSYLRYPLSKQCGDTWRGYRMPGHFSGPAECESSFDCLSLSLP